MVIRPRPKPRPFRREEPIVTNRINREIMAPQVRLVGENITPGIYPTNEALRMAQDMELDLVEISAQADPPVARIIDFTKFVYEQKKKQKEIKSKAAKTVVKEIRFGPNTGEGDLEFKLKHARAFLEEGSKVKAYVHFRGRTIIHSDRGADLLKRFIDGLEDVGKLEAPPKMEGKRMIVFLNPKGKK